MREYHVAYNAFHQLRFPDEQDPQMIMLIGDKSKTKAIRKFELSLDNDGNHKKIHLQLAPENTKARSPILIADCELHNAPPPSKASHTIAGVEHHPLVWHQHDSTEGFDALSLVYLVYARLISPISTLICFFADDLGGTTAVANLLASWLISLTYRSTDLPVSTYPRVLILTVDDSTLFSEEKATLDFMKELEEETKARNGSFVQESNGLLDALLRKQFGGLRVLALPNDVASQEQSQSLKLDASWKSLRTRILQGSQRVQDRRRKAQVAFSANHFKAFFHLSCAHFAEDIITPFSFVKASRMANPVPEDFSSHIGNFLRDIKGTLVESLAFPIIASAMTLDGYPPEMHSK
jgi:hypothetical protein